jgi:hypothetical protein
VNPMLAAHLEATYFEAYQLLRDELLALLSDDDLSFRPAGEMPTLGELCREIGEIEHSYVEALTTFRQDFRWRNPDPHVAARADILRAWFADLDRRLAAALEALTVDDIANRRIARSDFDVDDFAPHPPQELDVYREALLIFYGKASVYLRAMGRRLPGHWAHWIG